VRTKGAQLGALSFEFYHGGSKITDEIRTPIQTAYRGDGTIGQIQASFVLDVLNSGATESQTLGPLYLYTGADIVSVFSGKPSRLQTIVAPSPSEDPAFEYRHRLEFKQKFASAEWASIALTVFFREGFAPDVGGAVKSQIKIRFLTESTPVDMHVLLHAIQVESKPTVDFLVAGEAFPDKVDGMLETQFNRSGEIDEAGVRVSVGIRNRSADSVKYGPLHVYTTDVVKKFDTSRLLLGMGRDVYEPSDVEGFSRKFVKAETSDLDAFAYEVGEFGFELEARNINRSKRKLDVPVLVKCFTDSGPVEWRFAISVQRAPA
jgi:hypothetical protein